MAAGYLPTPGKVVDSEEIGPCVETCEHRDCAQTREMAETACAFCRKPIGYETGFVNLSHPDRLAHSLCARKALQV